MRMPPTCSQVLGLLAVAVVGSPAGAATLTFDAGEFAAWTAETFIGVNLGQTVVPEATGGNPDANLRVTTVTGGETFTGHFDPAIVLDPAANPINAIAASLDYQVLSAFGDGHGVGLILLEQAGSFYYAGGFVTGSLVSGNWNTASFLADDLTDYVRLAGVGTLDLGPGGAPVRLGFWTGNFGGNGISVRYDNWSATVNPVPAPPAFVLTLTAVAAAAGWSRRTRNR
jgi:hypothetical protein